MPHRGRGEMRRAAQSGGVAIALQKGLTALCALHPVIIKPHEQVRIFHLDRRMKQITNDHRIIALGTQSDGEMVNRMSGRWQ